VAIPINHDTAKEILFIEDRNEKSGVSDPIFEEWIIRIQRLSQLCPYRKSSTFVAALGTAILAKSVEPGVDVYCLLERDGEENSYSARSLADNVLARHRATLGVDLGANKANPLNNTPFIGKASIRDIGGVRNKLGFDYLKECLDSLAPYKSVNDARSALRAFLKVRRKNFVAAFDVGEMAGDHHVLPTLEAAIIALLSNGSEEGRVAQAVAAGLLASSSHTSDIEVGHVNDPDRNFPLDIAICQTVEGEREVVIAVEVKDKKIGGAEVIQSIEKAVELGVNSVIYLAVAKGQLKQDFVFEYQRARDMGCNLVIYDDWTDFIRTCIGFSTRSAPEIYSSIYNMIGLYLVELGVTQQGVDCWKGFSKGMTD
jgi:hypothetical protein